MRKLRWCLSLALVACALGATAPRAEQIVVSNYGVSASGMPFAVAMEKGFFDGKVTGILSSQGGGTTVRNLLAGDIAYAEVSPIAVATAIRQNAPLKIISNNVQTVSEFGWMVKIDSPIKSIADLKGRKLGYSSPRSVSQALGMLIVEKAGLKPSDVELVMTGGLGEALVALDLGAIDVAPATEPLLSKYRDKYRVIATADALFPSMSNVVGVTTQAAAEKRGDFLRAIVAGRAKAVAFMKEHPEEAAAIVAKVYKLEQPVALQAVSNLIGAKAGLPYWSTGKFDLAGLKEMWRAQILVGAADGDIDWTKMIDESFLPESERVLK
ncbi:ABC transporter substrate-binding protein [Bosea sp. 47.2.35]|uniref:ABC transporter substrate-binding protein n=1 Tax=Bosea sp. 47.2.35 TaxID=2969304 RepID=UPI0021504593|nr:ABC transporter substrate-binding protein [Bosea sp. 47.2.35]MCR4524178.1 ABC transporter substrate-binding protein [Bosea sp. 47.2.35]